MIIRYQYFSLWFRGKFTKCRNFTRRFVWLWRISGAILGSIYLGTNASNYFKYWWVGPVCSPPPLYSSSSISCMPTNPLYKTSSVTWLTLMPVRSEIVTRVRLRSGWIVAESTWHIRADRHLYGHLIIFSPSCVRVVVLFGGCLTVKN